MAYAYARALEAIFNTSFTTAVAFFATATSKIMPISTFGIFAAICVLMNYGLVMIATPAVWVLCTKRDPPTNDDEDALPESRTAGSALEAGEDVTEKKRCCKAPACCTKLVDGRRGLFGGYLRVVGKRPVALALEPDPLRVRRAAQGAGRQARAARERCLLHGRFPGLACRALRVYIWPMGTLIILTVAYSLGYSLLFFMPLLRVAGPEGRVGDICHFLRGLKCACCRRA